MFVIEMLVVGQGQFIEMLEYLINATLVVLALSVFGRVKIIYGMELLVMMHICAKYLWQLTTN